jgi:hypothetical protein
MSDYKILKPGKEWESEYLALDKRDIFYNSDYYQVNGHYAGWEPEMFVFSVDGKKIIYPYVKKPIRELGFGWEFVDFFDISTLEYGGAICGLGITLEIFQKFLDSFSEYCSANGIVSEFVRLHPFSVGSEFYGVTGSSKKVYYVDLNKSKEEILSEFKKSNYNSITKAQRSDVSVYKTIKSEHIAKFFDIYQETMKLRGAENFYFYSLEFIQQLIEKLKDKVKLFVAEREGKIIAGSLFLYDNDIVHYYLSGLNRGESVYSPSNLILYTAILDAKDSGFRLFNLGGGYSPADGLDNFKSSFTATSKNFYRFTKIHNQEVYDKIVNAKKATAEGKSYNKDYFPAYRG